MSKSSYFLKKIYEDYVQSLNKINQENHSFNLKKKNILNQSNLIFTEIIINYCCDLRNKLETFFNEYKNYPNLNTEKDKNIIQIMSEICFFQKEKDNKDYVLKELESFYKILNELNSLLLSKFKFTFTDVLNSIENEFKKGDSVIFKKNSFEIGEQILFEQDSKYLKGVIKEISEQKGEEQFKVVDILDKQEYQLKKKNIFSEENSQYQSGIITNVVNDNKYTVKNIFDNKESTKRIEDIYPDIMFFFIQIRKSENKDEDKQKLYSTVNYITKLLVGNEQGFEIKLYLLVSLLPKNLYHREFILNKHKYYTLDKPIYVWNDDQDFEKMKLDNLNKFMYLQDFENIYNSLYTQNTTLGIHSEIEIIYEDIVEALNLKKIYDSNLLSKNSTTKYVKILSKDNLNSYWIQLSDIEFQVTQRTYFYNYDKKLKRNLLSPGDSFKVDPKVIEKNNSIILPDSEKSNILFLTPVTLSSEYFIPESTQVFLKKDVHKKGTVVYHQNDKYKIEFQKEPKLVEKKREELIWDNYPSISGYIGIEDTNCYLLTEKNLNGLFMKYLDKDILENLFFIQSPVCKITDSEEIELDKIKNTMNKELGENIMNKIENIFERVSNPFQISDILTFLNNRIIDTGNLGLAIGLYYKPLHIIGGRVAYLKILEYLKKNRSNQLDLNLLRVLNTKKYYGQDLELLIYQSLKYDYQFDKTPVILKAIKVNQDTNGTFQINNLGYKMLVLFLEFYRINKSNRENVCLLMDSLLSLISSGQQVSRFLVQILQQDNLTNNQENICQEYLKRICNHHYLCINDITLGEKIKFNYNLKKFLSDYSESKLNRLQDIIEVLEINTSTNDEQFGESYRVIYDCMVFDNNNKKKYLIKKDDIVYKKKDSYPFLFTDISSVKNKNEHFNPKKLFVSVYFYKKETKTYKNLYIPRNNIEYSLLKTN